MIGYIACPKEYKEELVQYISKVHDFSVSVQKDLIRANKEEKENFLHNISKKLNMTYVYDIFVNFYNKIKKDLSIYKNKIQEFLTRYQDREQKIVHELTNLKQKKNKSKSDQSQMLKAKNDLAPVVKKKEEMQMLIDLIQAGDLEGESVDMDKYFAYQQQTFQMEMNLHRLEKMKTAASIPSSRGASRGSVPLTRTTRTIRKRK